MNFTKIEIKDLDLVPDDCIPIIEKQISFNDQQEIFFTHPNFKYSLAIYEIELDNVNLKMLRDIIQIQFKKGVYLKFSHDFVLTPEKAKLLGYEMSWNKDMIWILDLNLITLKHNENLLCWLRSCDYIVLKGCGYFNYRQERIEQGTILKYINGNDMCYEKMKFQMMKYLQHFKIDQILIQFPTCALNNGISVTRKSVLTNNVPGVFVDKREDILLKKELGINYLIENLDFDYDPNHPESVYQILKGSEPQPTAFSILIPRKQAKKVAKIDWQIGNPEDSYKTNLSEYTTIFEMD